MNYQNFLVVGGSGFVGRHLVAALAARGARVTVPTRRRDRARQLILLPTVDVVEMDPRDHRALALLAVGCDAVINLAGVLHSPRGTERGPNDYGPAFAEAHVEIPQALVSACSEAGVKRLLHMSALGADAKAPSEYLRSKAIGEQVVLAAEDLSTTVFRPSVIFGPEDLFLNRFAMLSTLFPVLALPYPDARFQPVYVGDVARAFLAALDDRASNGRIYKLCGPKEFTLRGLVEYVCHVTGRRRLVIGLPDWAADLQAWFLEQLPGPLLSRDNLKSMQVASVCDCSFPFGLQPVALEAAAPAWLAHVNPRERYPQLRWRARR
ncbi:MAG: complex I NDUFA9 subunit family protein [Burkholderiales bacterium]